MKKNVSVRPGEGFYLKDGRSQIFILFIVFMWAEADGNYVTLHLRYNKKRVVRFTLIELLSQLPSEDFVRVHKSFIVNMGFVNEMHSNTILIGSMKLPIGRSYKKEFSLSFSEFIKKKH